MSNLFPMFMKLEGKRCLVVGAGKVGEPKIAGLIDTGARIHVVALEATERCRTGRRPEASRSNSAPSPPMISTERFLRLSPLRHAP